MKCRICTAASDHFATAEVLGACEIAYFRCARCGFIQTEDPHWLEEAYTSTIAKSDVGLVRRQTRLAQATRALISAVFDSDAAFLDYGGGSGLFVRMMRDAGFDFYLWDKYGANIFARGFKGVIGARDRYELITAFEVFEHFVDPTDEVARLLGWSDNVFFSTTLVPEPPPNPEEWWYYGLDHGQHVSLYTVDSLRVLAARFDLDLVTNGRSLHLLTTRDIHPMIYRLLVSSKGSRLLNWLCRRESLLQRDYHQVTGRQLH